MCEIAKILPIVCTYHYYESYITHTDIASMVNRGSCEILVDEDVVIGARTFKPTIIPHFSDKTKKLSSCHFYLHAPNDSPPRRYFSIPKERESLYLLLIPRLEALACAHHNRTSNAEPHAV